MAAVAKAFSRTTRRTCISSYAMRTFATEASLASSVETSSREVPRHSRPTTIHPQKSVYIRSWDEIKSMPELFAMVRGVEKRFGRVREFRPSRDADVSTNYTSFFVVEFEDDGSLEGVPEKGTNIRVEVPVVQTDRPGGVSLADLDGLLPPQDRDLELDVSGLYGDVIKPLPTSDDAERATRIVELIIQRSTTETRERRPDMKWSQKPTGTALYHWGGFYQPEGPDASPVSWYMRQTLDKWHRDAQKYPPKSFGPSIRTEFVENTVADKVEVDPSVVVRKLEQEMRGMGIHVDQVSAEASSDSSPPETSVKDAADSTGPVLESLDSPTSSSPVSEAPTEPRPALRSRKRRILALAREHARTPIPDPDVTRITAETKVWVEQDESERKKAETRTMRERLLHLMSGSWS